MLCLNVLGRAGEEIIDIFVESEIFLCYTVYSDTPQYVFSESEGKREPFIS